MNRACLTILVALLAIGLVAYPCAAQQWAPSGVRVCQNGCAGDQPHVVSDGMGGAFIAWRGNGNDGDVYLQRITATGLIAPGWPPNGLPIVVHPSSQQFSGLAADGLGGALVSWEDSRFFPGTGPDAFAQRVLADGSLAPGWVLNGNPASLSPSDQLLPQIAPDGVGGAYLIWQDSRNYDNGYDAYAQHLTASGTAAPGWPGKGLALAALPGSQGSTNFIMSDGSGGALFIWSDGRPGSPGSYATRVHADGTIAAGWPTNGILVAAEGVRAAVSDEAGGFYAVSATPAPPPYENLGYAGAYYLRRFTSAGTPAPGWIAGPVQVCGAPGARAWEQLDGDGSGGVVMFWGDYRPIGGGDYASRVLSDGSIAPGWSIDGTLVSTVGGEPRGVARDGQGGAYVIAQTPPYGLTANIWHLTASGLPAPGWPQVGLRVAPSGKQGYTRIVADGEGGAILTWEEGCCGRLGIWAQRFGPDVPTPVLLSLVSAEARPDRVLLTWFAGDGSGLSASVYRRTTDSDWQRVGSVTADGTGRLRYEDQTVLGGERYSYRLGYEAGGGEVFSAEVWLDVPAGYKLALAGLTPNPADGDLTASFSLPTAEPARLQLLDVTGRVWLTREVGALGAGSHALRLGEGMRVPAGMYWLRLTQGGRSLLARGVVVR